ncbi:hypothetical protein O3P69_005452 [Scylla paramamosain]|uniref:Uncharacterized protein n=1 Tax=Scylla paramamosain TaxID=85552 RepID=A0AAW0UDQ4_SCYPA
MHVCVYVASQAGNGLVHGHCVVSQAGSGLVHGQCVASQAGNGLVCGRLGNGQGFSHLNLKVSNRHPVNSPDGILDAAWQGGEVPSLTSSQPPDGSGHVVTFTVALSSVVMFGVVFQT